MNLTLTEEQRMMVDTARQIATSFRRARGPVAPERASRA